MARAFYLLFGVVAYLVFFWTFLYLIAFVGNFPVIPFAVDRGPEAALPVAIGIDLALIALFGVQHSVMARAPFKAAWTRIVPVPVERSMYVLLASLCLILLFVSGGRSRRWSGAFRTRSSPMSCGRCSASAG
jgi:protein-S-isoprenylcysteine O-methyltransferase Ste14